MNQIWRNNLIWYPFFENYMPLEKPPTFVSILNSIYTMEHGTKPRLLDIPTLCRTYVFDFQYPLSDAVNKTDFEENWIRHFIQRRIGTETYSAFLLELIAKMNEIMPRYNVLFDALGEKYDLFKGSSYTKQTTEDETTDRDKTGNKTVNDTVTMETDTDTTSNGTSDNRYSDTPQNHLDNVRNGEYVTEYTYTQSQTTDHAESDSTRTGQTRETTGENEDIDRGLERTETYNGDIENRTDVLLKYMNESQSIYTMIYKDCDDLFFQIM